LLLPEIASAIGRSSAVRVYVCNVATQRGETQDYNLYDHVRALESHMGKGLIDFVVANNRFDARRPGDYTASPVKLYWPPADPGSGGLSPRLMLDDIVDPDNAHHHDPARLAAAVMRVFEHEAVGRRRSRIVRSA
jgi:hypothetical protein